MNNQSSLAEDSAERSSRQVQIYVLFTLAGLAAVGNVAIMSALCRKRHKSRSFSNINFLILQLAISDTLVAAFCLLADGIWKSTYQWLAGDFMCKFVKYMQMFALYTSTFIIVTIGVDRCVAIRCAITRFDHQRLVRYLSTAAWISAGFCSLPQIFIFRILRAPFTIESGRFEQCVTYGAYTKDWQEPAYIIFTFCAMFAIPLLLIIISYTLIFVKIKRESGPQSSINSSADCSRVNSFSCNTAEKRDIRMRKAKTKALCVSILVIVTFLLCWAPYYVSVLYYVILSYSSDGQPAAAYHLFQVIFFFGMSNSVLNPIVYGAFHMAHRSQLAWRKWHRRSFPHAQSSTNHVLGDPDSYSLVFSPLMRVNTLSSYTYTACKASPKIQHVPLSAKSAVGYTSSLDI
ncbi:putative gonadotropin-releasing hormone II receptor [Paramacrobiotus metropolitanus]|uniref:putative gonadotropin-releasing hormone II receptor n=1 Tax=Paramacrobiotus metropolitanus TaxID=2943436 RepID=UPI0024459EA1|nr:putative gonadotropin-releasing hormone II receptor [Paramacrobiotus metropolitanus]